MSKTDFDSDLRNVVIFSSCFDYWGGSEYLWAETAERLAKQGYQVHVFKLSIDFSHPRIKRLSDLGCRFTDLNEYLPNIVRRVWNRFLPYDYKRTLPFYIKRVLAKNLRRLSPRLFIISQGANFDGLPFVELCPLDKAPYVIISQKAINYLYPNDWTRKFCKEVWRNSAGNYFPSADNVELTQRQFGLKLKNAEVIQNPISVRIDEPLDWNFSDDEVVRIACAGRYYILDKGQDILLDVLSQKKWRERNIELSFYGKGVNEEGLKDLVRYFGLENVKFMGHVPDVRAIWKENQALILPSRNEGLPLVIIEAMMCGRIPIVTDVGGNTEIITDSRTGFIADYPSEKSLDEALERAWQMRHQWKQIGEQASKEIREFVWDDPVGLFTAKLLKIISDNKIKTEAEIFAKVSV